MNTQQIQHKEVINLIQATIQMNDALKDFLIKIEEEEQENQYILVKEAAALAEMSACNVRYLINTEQVKAKRKGKKWLVHKPSLIEHLEWKNK